MIPEPIDSLPHTRKLTISKLRSIGINTLDDLIDYYPTRYELFQNNVDISTVQEGEIVTINGVIAYSKMQYANSNLKIQKFSISDHSGQLDAVWYNQPYLLKLFKIGIKISIAGEIVRFGNKLQIIPKEYEILSNQIPPAHLHTGRIVPIYSEKRGLSSKTIRAKIWNTLQSYSSLIVEFLPDEIRKKYSLIEEKYAYQQIHFPDSNSQLQSSQYRLSFDELFLIQLSSRINKINWNKQKVIYPFKNIQTFKQNIAQFIESLPFNLTQSQQRVFSEIQVDFTKNTPMNRFLQGEVGSGKTVVAALASFITFLNGKKTIFMAPTEILAQQHFHTFSNLFLRYSNKFSLNQTPQITLITGSSNKDNSDIKNSDIIIGTHALLSRINNSEKIGFIVIDEQHRFGVEQRSQLIHKGMHPHLLTMTATPIPRTVMLTLYGELDSSTLDEMPNNRLKTKTYLIPQQKREKCYTWISNQINTTHVQAFIVCPFIEDSATETLTSVKAAKSEYLKLQKHFPSCNLGLLHGKMSLKEKAHIMNQFKNNQVHILVTTPVVEVGIDIPNATIMIIEGAERYGLAQLHQLRGRIGRGVAQSYCFAFTSDPAQFITKRLSYFTKFYDGRLLAEKDLLLRGPGNIFGTHQHGYTELKIASLTDYSLIEKTKNAVDFFITKYKLSQFKELTNRLKKLKLIQIENN